MIVRFFGLLVQVDLLRKLSVSCWNRTCERFEHSNLSHVIDVQIEFECDRFHVMLRNQHSSENASESARIKFR
jgi:hypothetical protein